MFDVSRLRRLAPGEERDFRALRARRRKDRPRKAERIEQTAAAMRAANQEALRRREAGKRSWETRRQGGAEC